MVHSRSTRASARAAAVAKAEEDIIQSSLPTSNALSLTKTEAADEEVSAFVNSGLSPHANKAFTIQVPKTRKPMLESSAPSPASIMDDSASAVSYQTPGTSAAATPAIGSGEQKPRRTRGVNAAQRAAELQDSIYSLSRKRPREDEYDNIDSEDDYPLASRKRVDSKSASKPLQKRRAPPKTSFIAIDTTSEDDIAPTKRSAKSAFSPSKSKKLSSVEADAALARSMQQEIYDEIDRPSFSAPSKKEVTDAEDEDAMSTGDSKETSVIDLTEYRSEDEFMPPTKGERTQINLDDSDSDSDLSSAVDMDLEEGDSVSYRTAAERRRMRALLAAEGTKEERLRKKLLRLHPFMKTMWKDLEDTEPTLKEQAKQPDGIKQRLKPFQLEGLNWLIKQEQTKWKGGLLADEMGMGKTIQAVSLIMSDFPQRNPTLVVVPPVALMQWQSEIEKYTDGKLKVLVYHGTNSKSKGLKRAQLMKFNVIMVSYSGLESLYRKQTKGFNRKDEDGEPIKVREDSVLHEIHYHRVILDEAHNIKSRSASSTKACCELNADYRWCLSGTPLQNRIGELFSLLRFLRVEPFACYACKACDCSQLDWHAEGDNKACTCGHIGLQHISIFNYEMLDPIRKYGNEGDGQEAFRKLKCLTDAIMLRREKKNNTASMELPIKNIEVDTNFFGEVEQDFASSIMSNNNRKFDHYVARGVVLNNYANIFGLIMQMRQIADHPDLLLKRHSEGGQNVLVCVICNEPAEDVVRSNCKHDFCRMCAKEYFESMSGLPDNVDCPRCHVALQLDFEQPEVVQEALEVKKNSIINKINMAKWTSSTKIEILVNDLADLRVSGHRTKSIVFSQFTSMLQLIEWRLKNAGFKSVLLDGSMSPAQRQASINHFMTTPDVEVFLVSLKAGGVALNLTEASRVFIVDPWWNPAAEWQSADRCHRIGQNRPCQITRLCIEDSVESRIVLLQEKKANMIHSTIDSDKTAMANLSAQDMQFLFHG